MCRRSYGIAGADEEACKVAKSFSRLLNDHIASNIILNSPTENKLMDALEKLVQDLHSNKVKMRNEKNVYQIIANY